jgi:hypothetical protein
MTFLRLRKTMMKRARAEAEEYQAQLRLAASVIVTGSGTGQAIELLNLNNVPTPSSKQIYAALEVVCNEIVQFGRESCLAAQMEVPVGDVVSFDGSWDHRRNAEKCIVPVMSESLRKVICYGIAGRCYPKNDPRFCAISQNMETHALKLTLPCLKALNKIAGYVHDNDAKAKNAIKVAQWPIQEHIDPGHAQKAFVRKLDSFSTKNNNVLADLEGSLSGFFKIVTHMDATADKKVEFWMNSTNHYCGVHSKCPMQHATRPVVWAKGKDPKAVGLLNEFLTKTCYIIRCVVGEYSSQLNESFNRGKSKFANKDTNWGMTWEARMCCAVLDRNVDNWRLQLMDRLQLPLSWQCRERLAQMERARLLAKVHQLDPERLKEEREARKEWKARLQKAARENSVQKVSYKGMPPSWRK